MSPATNGNKPLLPMSVTLLVKTQPPSEEMRGSPVGAIEEGGCHGKVQSKSTASAVLATGEGGI